MKKKKGGTSWRENKGFVVLFILIFTPKPDVNITGLSILQFMVLSSIVFSNITIKIQAHS